MTEREQFEEWYSTHAFDYESNPIGCRDCALQWDSWQAAGESLRARIEELGRIADDYRRHWKDAEAELSDRQKFKTYVHERLDAMGAPHSVPESKHDKEGCRVGGRLDWIESKLSAIKQQPVGIYTDTIGDAGHVVFLGDKPPSGTKLYLGPAPIPNELMDAVRGFGASYTNSEILALLAAAPKPGDKP